MYKWNTVTYCREKRKSVNRMIESKNAKWDDLMRKSSGSITSKQKQIQRNATESKFNLSNNGARDSLKQARAAKSEDDNDSIVS